MLELKVVLSNEQAELLDRHLAFHEVGLTEAYGDGVTMYTPPEDQEVTEYLVLNHAIRAALRAHRIHCQEKDREDIRERGRRLALARQMRQTPRKGR